MKLMHWPRYYYTHIMDRLRVRIRSWLGINKIENDTIRLLALTRDLVSIGVDVHFKEPAMILVYSRLNGGQIREIKADFRDMRELEELCRELKHRYNTDRFTFDAPQFAKEVLCKGMRW